MCQKFTIFRLTTEIKYCNTRIGDRDQFTMSVKHDQVLEHLFLGFPVVILCFFVHVTKKIGLADQFGSRAGGIKGVGD